MSKSEFTEMNETNNEEVKPEFNRYSNAKVYKLISDVDDYFYIGSTCTSLSKRLHQHKSTSKKSRLYSQQNVYTFQ